LQISNRTSLHLLSRWTRLQQDSIQMDLEWWAKMFQKINLENFSNKIMVQVLKILYGTRSLTHLELKEKKREHSRSMIWWVVVKLRWQQTLEIFFKTNLKLTLKLSIWTWKTNLNKWKLTMDLVISTLTLLALVEVHQKPWVLIKTFNLLLPVNLLDRQSECSHLKDQMAITQKEAQNSLISKPQESQAKKSHNFKISLVIKRPFLLWTSLLNEVSLIGTTLS